MYLVVIMAFALILSDDLPPKQMCILPSEWGGGWALGATLAFIAFQAAVVAIIALVTRRLALRRMDGSAHAHDDAAETFSAGQRAGIIVIAVALAVLMLCLPWIPLLREWTIGDNKVSSIPLFVDLLLLSPFALDLLIMWSILYPAELCIRRTPPPDQLEALSEVPGRTTEGGDTLASAKAILPAIDDSLGTYLLDKFRHQVLIIAAPMTCIVFAKYFTDLSRPALEKATGIPWISDSILGTISVVILACAPIMLRYIWATEPLPAGPLRDRFERTCRRIGLKYREILLWHTHGMAINAAVMGFIAPLRYVLVSDALLETMTDEEIEAVFGHEAGHVVHWHLQFFVLFALVSMYIAGGVLELLWIRRIMTDIAALQLIALAVLLLCWLFGFGWISRRFERQADLHGIRCITPDIRTCEPTCPVHGKSRGPGLCLSAARIFGKTLMRIGDLNGIPRDAPSWRHGTIESRCRLIAEFAAEPAAVTRFDRSVLRIKSGLLALGLIGTVVAAIMYYHDIQRALGI